VSDIDTAAADSLKVLDPERPIREADVRQAPSIVSQSDIEITANSARQIQRISPKGVLEVTSITAGGKC
jgi:hypothetical protein